MQGRRALSALIDVPYRPLLTGAEYSPARHTDIHLSVSLGEYCVIGQGVSIASGSIIDHHVIIEQDVTIGEGTLVCYRAQICAESRIDSHCVIGGFVGERSTLHSGARMFGALVHRHPRTCGGWDDDGEMCDGPTIGEGAFIGFGAVIVGDIQIGAHAYVGANSVVRANVPDDGIVAPGSVFIGSSGV